MFKEIKKDSKRSKAVRYGLHDMTAGIIAAAACYVTCYAVSKYYLISMEWDWVFSVAALLYIAIRFWRLAIYFPYMFYLKTKGKSSTVKAVELIIDRYMLLSYNIPEEIEEVPLQWHLFLI